jgi:hypothetical protein
MRLMDPAIKSRGDAGGCLCVPKKPCTVIASEAKQFTLTESVWIATSAFGLLAMTDWNAEFFCLAVQSAN